MNLTPELTARIEELKKRYSSPYYERNYTTAGIIDMTSKELAEPLHKEMEELKSQLERERMCHAACGVIAMSNTPEALARVRDMHPDYLSASVQDCIRVVEREISLKAQLAEAKNGQEVGDGKEARLLMGLIRLTDEEAEDGKWCVTLEYDNYQDGALVRNGDDEIISECYDINSALAEEPQKHCEWKFMEAIRKAIEQKP